MGHQLGWGLALVFLGGMLNGSFAAPLKKLPAWRWENNWLIYAITGLLVLPWIVALATVPHLAGVFQQSSISVMIKVALFGFAWGIGGLLFGQGMARVGLALGFALILGITSSFGALIPLAILHHDQLWERPGLALMAGTVVMSLGLVLLAIAGKRRERDQAAASERSNFAVGHHLLSLRHLLRHAQLCLCLWRGDAPTDTSRRVFHGHVGQCHLGAGSEFRLSAQCGLLHLPPE
jgi:L-rhamnose-H+ transport protein